MTLAVRRCLASFVVSSLAAASNGFGAGDTNTVFTLGKTVIFGKDPGAADSAVAYIPAETIQMFERRDLSQALNLVPGVTMNNVGPRNETGVYVRGFDLRQVPLFIDGIPVYVPYDGYADLGRFTTYDTAEISVSKGFSSVILGPNALGGAINVVSRRPTKPFEADARAGWFSGDSREAAINFGTRQKNWYLQAGGSYLEQDTFPLSADFVPRPTEDGGDRNNAHRQDWKANAKIAYTPNGTDEYAVGFVHQEGEKGNPPYAGVDPTQRARFWRWPEWNKRSIYYVSHTQIGDASYVKPRVFFDKFDNTLKAFDNATYSTQNAGSSFTSIYDDYTWGASLEAGTELISDNTLRAAFHYKSDHHDEHNVGQPNYVFEDETFSMALEDMWKIGEHWSVVPGVSYDIRNVVQAVDTNNGTGLGGDTFDSINPQIGLFYALPKKGTLRATVSRKSRFPTIKDRYSYRLGTALPNPDLEPETAMHYELGYSGKIAKGFELDLALFFSRIDDAIQRVDNVATGAGGAPLFQLRNVGVAEHVGAEAGLGYEWADWGKAGVNYTWLSRENLSAPNIFPLDTPQHKVFGYADIKPVEWLSLIPSLEFDDDRYSTSAGFEADSFFTANFKVAIRLPRGFTLNGGVNNIFDENYELAEGFAEPGRNFFANITYRF